MRDARVLVNRTGPRGNVLKIHPPLAFSGENVELLIDPLSAALTTTST
jgi:4-aminobutyrate aminotransferase-like enzyme